jgi:hypothetical protein
MGEGEEMSGGGKEKREWRSRPPTPCEVIGRKSTLTSELIPTEPTANKRAKSKRGFFSSWKEGTGQERKSKHTRRRLLSVTADRSLDC